MFNKSNFLNSLKTIKAWEGSKIRKIVKKQDNPDRLDKPDKLEKLFSFNDVIVPGLDPTCFWVLYQTTLITRLLQNRKMFKIGTEGHVYSDYFGLPGILI